jgi:hypothetical protein
MLLSIELLLLPPPPLLLPALLRPLHCPTASDPALLREQLCPSHLLLAPSPTSPPPSSSMTCL